MLTDLGAAVKAAIFPDLLRNPRLKLLPANHPEVPSDYWPKALAKARMRVPSKCAANIDVQLLAVSMLRK